MPFEFRFQRILDLRQSLERQQMLQLSAVLARREEAAREVENWQQKVVASMDDLRRLYQSQPIAPSDVQGALAHHSWLHMGHARAVEHLSEAEADVEDAREALRQATLQRKVLERLRERHAEEYFQMQDRREQAELDEIGTRPGRDEDIQALG